MTRVLLLLALLPAAAAAEPFRMPDPIGDYAVPLGGPIGAPPTALLDDPPGFPGGPGGPAGPPALPGAPQQVPLDGGLGALALAGAAYAARRLRAQRLRGQPR